MDDVTARVAARLLRSVGEGVAGERCRPEVLMRRVMGTAAATDAEVRRSFVRRMRILAEDGLVAAWKRDHPRETRLLGLSHRQPKGSPNPRILKAPLGHLVVSSASRPGLPQIPGPVLEGLFADRHAPVAVGIDELTSLLQPRDGHGGWCDLLDLLHAIAGIDPKACNPDLRPNAAPCRILPLPSRNRVAGEANSR